MSSPEKDPRSDGSALLRAAGLLAVAGGVANGIGDYMLQGGPRPGPGINTYAQLAEAPYDGVFLGSLIGNATIPLWLLGLWPVYVALRPAGRPLALPPVLFMAYAFSIFPGYHGSYALYAAGFQAQAAVPAELATTLQEMVDRMHAHHGAVLYLIVFSAPIGSLWFAAVVLFRETLYRRWMAIVSPILVPLTQPLAEMLPAPYGAYIRPAWGTTIFTLFFLVTTLVVWNVPPDRDAEVSAS
jgi:hypothetical protein